jgi:putative chitinase
MLLKIGSTGEDVKKLQAKLGLKPDGSFGVVTEAKVKQWQKSNGLIVDGVVGTISWNKLFPPAPPAAKPDNGLKLGNLKGLVPDVVIVQIPEVITKFNISNVLRLTHFLAQCGHESADFTAVRENLNYSAEGLKKIFPRYFPEPLNQTYARQPDKIASRAYAGRMGNGDEASGDGYKFRGRGYIQLTGKLNYASFGKFIGEDTIANSDLVASKYPLASAAFFFDVNKLWEICDKGASVEVVTALTKRINGGTNGLDDRINRFNRYYSHLK